VLKTLIAEGAKLAVLGRNERLADLPELKSRSGIDLLARTLDYNRDLKLLAVGEEDVSDVIRVFAAALYQATAKRPVDPNWENRGRAVQQYELRVKRLDVRFDEALKSAHEKAVAAGKWKGAAAVNDRVRYWSAGVMAYFDAPCRDAAPTDAPHPIDTREALKTYDPDLFALVEETMAYRGHVDWRFTAER
jgi:alpha-glucosidase